MKSSHGKRLPKSFLTHLIKRSKIDMPVPKSIKKLLKKIFTMKTVILCGGKGSRMSALTEKIPKPLVHVGERPVLWHIMKIYATQGFSDFMLCLGYIGEEIKKYFEK